MIKAQLTRIGCQVTTFSVACIMASSAFGGDASKLSLTIYNNDLALIQETRALDLNAGRNKLEFKDVSASIRPETVSLTASGIGIVEQNFDFDLLTPEKLMERQWAIKCKLCVSIRVMVRR